METTAVNADRSQSSKRCLATVIVPILEESPVLDFFLSGLWDTLPQGTRLVLIDDGSPAACKEVIRTWAPRLEKRLELIVLSNSVPLGDGVSFNRALEQCAGDLVIRLDSDLLFKQSWFEHLIAPFTDTQSVGSVSGVLLYPQSGGINHAGISFYQFVARHTFLNARPDILKRQTYPVQTMTLGFAAIRRSFLEKCGGFDLAYNSGYDDLDLNLRIAQSGGKLLVTSLAEAYHWERSAGPYRDTSRKRNLALFWHRWGNQIRDDLWAFSASRLESLIHVGPSGDFTDWLGIDLAGDRPSASAFWDELPKHVTMKLDTLRVLAHRCPKEGLIPLPLVLGADSHREPRRLIILVDNFVRIRGNAYFSARRREVRDDDIVVDFHGNAELLREICAAAWPGEKVR